MDAFSPDPSVIIVSSFVISAFFTYPSTPKSEFSRVIPKSSEINVAPVKIAISCIKFFLLSPNPGAFTAHILRPPFSLLIIRVAKTSDSTSSAIIKIGFADFTECSS